MTKNKTGKDYIKLTDKDYKKQIECYHDIAKRLEQGEQLLLNGMQDTLRDAASAIETLLAERDAAVFALKLMIDSCRICEKEKKGI